MRDKNCLNCAYFLHESDDVNTDWIGFSARCYCGMWTRASDEILAPLEFFETNNVCGILPQPKSQEQLAAEFGGKFLKTEILLSDQSRLDLEAHKCQNYRHKNKRGTMDVKDFKDHEDQKKKDVKSWLGLGIAFLSALTAFIWLIWRIFQ